MLKKWRFLSHFEVEKRYFLEKIIIFCNKKLKQNYEREISQKICEK